MFETSQQEPNSGTGKIVGGVIAVVAVILVVVYFAFLHHQPPSPVSSTSRGKAAQATATGEGEKADAMKDLTIANPNLRRDPATQTMAVWDFQVINRSRSYGYKDIKYATNYYNSQDAVIYHNEGTLPEAVEPGDQHTFSGINDGLYPVGATRYTIELKGAEPVE